MTENNLNVNDVRPLIGSRDFYVTRGWTAIDHVWDPVGALLHLPQFADT